MKIEFINTHVKHLIGERRSRHIKGQVRKALRDKIATNCIKPSRIRNAVLLDMSPNQFVAGNRDSAGATPSVFQKISSESRATFQCDGNLIVSLMKLREGILDDPESLYKLLPNSNVPGYLQCIHAYPFAVICYTEAGVRLYHSLAAQHPLYCDATGTIVSLSRKGHRPSMCTAGEFEERQLLYYALVLSNSKAKQKTVTAVAEFISSDHSVPAISNFLQVFRRSEAQLYGYSNKVTPSHIVIDRSRVLLLSFLHVYNNESLQAYLERCFRVVTNSGSDEDYNGMFISACISHVMNSFKGDLKIIFKQKAIYRFAMYCMSILVNCMVLDHVEKCLVWIKQIFGSSFINDDVTSAYNNICTMMSSLGCSDIESVELDQSSPPTGNNAFCDHTINEDDGDHMGGDEEDLLEKSSKKPFGTYFAERMKKIELCSKGSENNKFYQPQLMMVLQKKWIPTLPIWTSLMRGNLQRHQNAKPVTHAVKKEERTSGVVESWHNVLKNIDHGQEKRMRPDVFLSKHHPMLLGRQVLFIDELDRRKKNVFKKHVKPGKPLKEQWSKRGSTNRKPTSYQTAPLSMDTLPKITENPEKLIAASANVLQVKRPPNYGLLNVSRTVCWLNAAIQLIEVTSIPLYLYGINEDLLTDAQKQYISIHKDLAYQCCDPTDFLQALTVDAKSLTGNCQQDAAEGVMHLLDALTETAQPLRDMFALVIKREMKCSSCSNAETSFVSMMNIVISSRGQAKTIEQCWKDKILSHVNDDAEYNLCGTCHNRHIVESELARIPEFQVVQISRHIGRNRIKDESPVEITKSVTIGFRGIPIVFSLAGIIVHHGKYVHSGHYTALIRNNKCWTEYSDDSFIELQNITVALYQREHAEVFLKCESYPLILDYEEVITLNKASESFKWELTNDRDIRTLQPGTWLETGVIVSYLQMLKKEAYQVKETIPAYQDLRNVFVYDPTFLPALISKGYKGVERHTKNVDIFDQDLLLFPVHQTGHWVLLAVVLHHTTIYWIDSLHGLSPETINWIWYYLCRESRKKRQQRICMTDWSYCDSVTAGVPFQTNSCDCGVFVCMNARCLAFEAKFICSSQCSSEAMHTSMALELLTCTNKNPAKNNNWQAEDDAIAKAGSDDIHKQQQCKGTTVLQSKEDISNQLQGSVKNEDHDLFVKILKNFYMALAKEEEKACTDFPIGTVEEDLFQLWMNKETKRTTDCIRYDPDCVMAITCLIPVHLKFLLCVAGMKQQCIVVIPEDVDMIYKKELCEFRKLIGIHWSLHHNLGRRYSNWSVIEMKSIQVKRSVFMCKYLYKLYKQKKFTINEQDVIIENESESWVIHELLKCDSAEEILKEAEITQLKKLINYNEDDEVEDSESGDELNTLNEDDPEGKQLLIPEFISGHEEDDDFDLPWGKNIYLKFFPKLPRPSDSESLFPREYVRTEVKRLEPHLRQLYIGDCISSFNNEKVLQSLRKMKRIEISDYWPIDLEDLGLEIEYFLMGLESDILKQSSTLPLGWINKYIILPELLTGLLMAKYSIKYQQAVECYLQRLLPPT